MTTFDVLVVESTPGAAEQGVGCIIRAGVPLVEEGSAILDPCEGYVTRRVVGHDVSATCEAAVDESFGPLRTAVRSRIARLMTGAGHDAADVTIDIRRMGSDLRVDLSGPPVPEPVRQAIGVRVLDALRSERRTFGTVDVGYIAS